VSPEMLMDGRYMGSASFIPWFVIVLLMVTSFPAGEMVKSVGKATER